jgi:hypothetical protein
LAFAFLALAFASLSASARAATPGSKEIKIMKENKNNVCIRKRIKC